MKAISKITIGLVAAALLVVGCGGDGAKSSSTAKVTKVIAEESLGLRKTDLYSENSTTAAKTEYRTAAPGSSSKIKRAFQDAPPMIPHDTEGMLPIKVGNNQCTGCHMPDVAMYMDPKPTPIPESHFTDFRPKHKLENGVFKKVVDNYKNEVAIKKQTNFRVQDLTVLNVMLHNRKVTWQLKILSNLLIKNQMVQLNLVGLVLL